MARTCSHLTPFMRGITNVAEQEVDYSVSVRAMRSASRGSPVWRTYSLCLEHIDRDRVLRVVIHD